MAHSNLSIAQTLAEQGIDLRDRHWHALSGGRTNRIWRVDDADQPIVVKFFKAGAGNALFPNCAAAESEVLHYLAGRELAPRLNSTADLPDGKVVIYRYLPGNIWQSGTALVARLLWRLHSIAPTTGLRKVANGSREIMTEAEIFRAPLDHETRQLLRHLYPRTPVAASNLQCLLHGDVVPANIIVTSEGARLIDWQCPAIGDPCHDLGIFLSPAMQLLYRGAPLTVADENACLAAYGDAGITRRYLALAPWYHYRMAAYCFWRAANGATEYLNAAHAEIAALERADRSEICASV